VRDAKGEPVLDDTFLWLCNAHHEPLTFILPGTKEVQWKTILDSIEEAGFIKIEVITPAGEEIKLMERSLCLLQLSSSDEIFAHEQIGWTRSGS
jgi:glycogen operon protein